MCQKDAGLRVDLWTNELLPWGRILFFSEIQELSQNDLRLVVSEGMPVGEEAPVPVGGSAITGGTLIEVTEERNTFEVI